MRSTDATLTGAALLAVLLLSAAAAWLEPPRVSLLEAASREGARVEVEARVIGLRAPWLELADGGLRMPAFARALPELARGDLVRAVGIVSRGESGLLLSVESLEVTLPTARAVRQPADLAARPADFDGALVVLEGEVREGAIVGGGARVRLAGEGAPSEGWVVATGTFRYRERDASYVLWVESWTRP